MGTTEALEKACLVGRGRGRWETTNYGGVIDDDGDDGELYYLKKIFSDKSGPDDLEYGAVRKTSLSMTTSILIRSTWEHVPPYPLP